MAVSQVAHPSVPLARYRVHTPVPSGILSESMSASLITPEQYCLHRVQPVSYWYLVCSVAGTPHIDRGRQKHITQLHSPTIRCNMFFPIPGSFRSVVFSHARSLFSCLWLLRCDLVFGSTTSLFHLTVEPFCIYSDSLSMWYSHYIFIGRSHHIPGPTTLLVLSDSPLQIYFTQQTFILVM